MPGNNRVTKLLAVVAVVLCTLLGGCFYPSETELAKYRQPEIYLATFSPTQDLIVFDVFNFEHSGIFLMDRRGKVVRWLVKKPKSGWCGDPVFSPDGQKIVFIAAVGGNRGNLYLMDKDGGNLTRLTTGPHYERRPCFSPDGRRVYFIRHDAGGGYPTTDRFHAESWESDVYQVEVATKAVQRVTREEYFRLFNLAVFPDERHLLLKTVHYQSKKEEAGNLLWKVDLADPRLAWPVEPNLYKFESNPRPDLEGYTVYIHINEPVLSRDGRQLIFGWAKPAHGQKRGPWPRQQLYLCRMDNMQTVRVTNAPRSVAPLDISRDNQWVLFSQYSENHRPMTNGVLPQTNLYMIRRDGGGLINFSLDFSAVLGRPPVNPKLP